MSITPEDPRRTQPQINVSSTTALVASVPYLVGFEPHESVVLIFLSQETHQVVVTLRIDLPPAHDPAVERDVGRMVADTIARAQMCDVDLHIVHIVLWHLDAAQRSRGRLLAVLSESLQGLGITVGHWLASDGSALWDYGADHGSCCDGEGHKLLDDDVLQAHFALVMAEYGFADSRASLETALAPDAARRLSETQFADAEAMHESAEFEGHGAAWRREVEDAIVCACQRRLDYAELAVVGALWAVALADARVREPVMYRLLRVPRLQERSSMLRRCREWLTALATITPDAYCAPVAATLAAIAWQQGDGACASIAAERALTLNPHNSLAQIVLASATSGMPPQQWQEVLTSLGLTQLRGTQRAPTSAVQRDYRDPAPWPKAG